MARKYLAFDLETATEVPGVDFDWHAHRPLGICCAAALAGDTRETLIWQGKDAAGAPADRMSREEVRSLVDRLCELAESGYTLLTWNGLGFDFDVLAEESDAFDKCRELAVNHVDMMFHVFCDRGFPVALEKAAQGLKIPGKPEGMSGMLAPQYWSQGQFQKVLDYVAQDVRIALQVAELCEKQQSFVWTTRKGKRSTMPLPRGWLTVRDALRLPEPDTSWMSQPLPREHFTRWLSKR